MTRMLRPIALWISFSILAPAYATSDGEDVVFKAMRDELGRSRENLRLEGLEKPYFISYRVVEQTGARITASFGSLLNKSEARSRNLTVEVRVGDYALDNTNYLSLPSGPSGATRWLAGTATLALDDDYNELRRQIWLATDSAYKKALEDLSGKRAALQNKTRAEDLPDFSREEAIRIEGETPPPEPDIAGAQTLVRDLSALFKQMPDIFASSIQLVLGQVHTRYINSEGTVFSRRTPLVMLTGMAATQAADGMPLDDFTIACGRSMIDLPSRAELTARAQEMGRRLAQLRQAPALDRYNGPVLVEGEAAAEIFMQVFAPKLLALRRPITDSVQLEGLVSRPDDTFIDRIGGRVLPEFLDVVDNPTVAEYNRMPLCGGYRVDDDGVRARETVLVKGGVLQTLLTTRSPVAGITHSTGNRRGIQALPSNLFISTERGLSEDELRTRFLGLVKQRGKEYGIIVRRIVSPVLKLAHDPIPGPVMEFDQSTRTIGRVVEAYKVFPDGREELIRKVEISDVTVAIFKDIVAASRTSTIYNAPFRAREPSRFSIVPSFDPGGFASGSPIVSSVVPSLLFEELTLKKPSGEFPKPPVARHPYFDK